MFPLFLKLHNRLCLVVGGGLVGRRKAAALLEGGARVRLVCLEPRPTNESIGNVEWLREPYQTNHLDGVSLVFAAATPEVNQHVAHDGRQRGLWVNVADDPDAGDFLIPATLRRGDLAIAVSTGGAAPGLAQEIRNQLEGQFDEAFGQWVAVLAEVRPQILARITSAEQRRNLFARLCQWEWLKRLRRDGAEVVLQALRAEVDDLAKKSGN